MSINTWENLNNINDSLNSRKISNIIVSGNISYKKNVRFATTLLILACAGAGLRYETWRCMWLIVPILLVRFYISYRIGQYKKKKLDNDHAIKDLIQDRDYIRRQIRLEAKNVQEVP